MKLRIPAMLASLAVALIAMACSTGTDGGSGVPADQTVMPDVSDAAALDPDLDGIPDAYHGGARAYATWCAECHGARGEGSDSGPPHVHVIYEPNHHPDQSFINAARIGVSAHHWDFGDMLPVEGVTDDELQAIVDYVRWLQREAGIQ